MITINKNIHGINLPYNITQNYITQNANYYKFCMKYILVTNVGSESVLQKWLNILITQCCIIQYIVVSQSDILNWFQYSVIICLCHGQNITCGNDGACARFIKVNELLITAADG